MKVKRSDCRDSRWTFVVAAEDPQEAEMFEDFCSLINSEHKQELRACLNLFKHTAFMKTPKPPKPLKPRLPLPKKVEKVKESNKIYKRKTKIPPYEETE